MFEKNGEGSLEKLQRKLYSRIDSLTSRRAARLSEHDIPVQNDWGGGALPLERSPEGNLPLLKKVFVASLLFFLVAAGVAFYFLIGGSNTISSGNIDIRVEGPATIDAAKELSLAITVENGNATPLEFADLLVEFPEGTKSVQNQNVDFIRHRESLGDIPSGVSVTKAVQATLFGGEGEEKTIKITIEYRVPGSNAIFYKEKNISVRIGSAPVGVVVDAVDEISSNQDVELKVTITSNSTSPLKGLLLRAEYPFGFSFREGSVAPSYGSNIWNIGDLPPGEKKTIHIRGSLSGEDNEERVFRFLVGSQHEKDARSIGAVFMTAIHSITLEKPFIGADLALNGETAKTITVPAGALVRGDILWSNNISSVVTNVEIEAKLKGASLDRSSVSAPGGFYRSSDDTILWNEQTTPVFASVEPGESGTVQFSFAPQGSASVPPKNQAVDISITIRGQRLDENNVPEEVISVIEKRAVFSSNLVLGSRGVHATGPFRNIGPLPPKVDTETTYTITWSLANSSNALSRAKVVASLPPSVTWLGMVSPSDAPVTFNPVGGIITWNAGDIPPGVGFTSSSKEVSFQVSLRPSVSQVGTAPVLLNAATATADDQFTGTEVRATAGQVTTEISSDPAYVFGQGFVGK